MRAEREWVRADGILGDSEYGTYREDIPRTQLTGNGGDEVGVTRGAMAHNAMVLAYRLSLAACRDLSPLARRAVSASLSRGLAVK